MNGNYRGIIILAIFFYLMVAVTYNILEELPLLKFIMILVGLYIPVILYKEYKKDFRTKINSVYIPSYFEELYQEVCKSSNIHLLEAMRKKARNRMIVLFLGFIILFIGMIKTNILLMFTGIIIMLLCSNNKSEKQYKVMYKEEVLSEFIKLVNDNLKFNNKNINSEMIEHTYKIANFDNKSFNIFKTDDYIEGQLEDNIYAKMSDLHIQRREVYYDDGKRKERIIEIFQGMFVETECNKDIETYIKISKNKLKIFGQQDRVEMDSQEFEKYFDIYSENKILAMQLLTSDVMTTLIDFYTRYNMEYEIVIRNNTIYMRFFTGAMFEPKLFGDSMDKKLLFSYYVILKFIVDVTKEVNKALKEVEI